MNTTSKSIRPLRKAALAQKPQRKVAKPLQPKAEVVELFSLPRPFVATVYDRKKHVLKTYHFKHLDNAVPRMTRYALRLAPGSVVEIAHAVTGKQIGTIKVHTSGRFTTQGDWALFL